jgi:hypothetical protein
MVVTALKFFITAKRESIIDGAEEGVRDKQEFSRGITFFAIGFAFTAWRLREITRALFQDLREAAGRS